MSAAAAGQAAAAAPDQPESLDGHDKALGACAHGHCHHGAAYTPVEVPPCQERPRLTAKHNLLRLAVRSSDPKFGLMRPPRA